MFNSWSILIVAAAMAVASAYTFNDPGFNQHLFDEYLATPYPQPITTAAGKTTNDCCKDFKIDAAFYKTRQDINTQCAVRYRTNNTHIANFDPFNCLKMLNVKHVIVCENECYAQAINFVDAKGKFNREAIIKRYTDNLVQNEWRKAVFEEYVDSCLDEVKNKLQIYYFKCNSIALDFHRCMWNKFIVGCPVESRVDSVQCNETRERLSKANPFFSVTNV